jgi:hypothetical protein
VGVTSLGEIIGGERPPGVYRWLSTAYPDALRREAVAAGWTCHVLDGGGLTGAEDLFDRCASLLAFPEWFGRNWDALADCLADLSWLAGAGHVLLWEHYGTLWHADPGAWRLAYAALTAAVRTRRETGAVPLCVLVRGSGPELGPGP